MSSDFLNQNQQPDLLENYGIPSDPRERKQFEAEKMAAFRNQQPSAAPSVAQASTQQSIPPLERVFLVNNLARPIHIPALGGNPEVVIDGQLAVSPSGPFLQMSRTQLNNDYQLQAYMSEPISIKKGHPKYGKPKVEEITEAEFRKQHAEYRRKKTIREAEYAKTGNVNKHGDGSVDEVDSAFEMGTINPNIVRATG